MLYNGGRKVYVNKHVYVKRGIRLMRKVHTKSNLSLACNKRQAAFTWKEGKKGEVTGSKVQALL